MKRFLVWFMQVTGLVTLIMFSVFPVSCRVTPEGIQIIGADYTCPVIEDFRVISEREAVLVFSDSVRVNGLVVSERHNIDINPLESETSLDVSLEDACGLTGRLDSNYDIESDGKTVRVTFDETQVGRDYILYGETEDKRGSTLTFALPFIGYNSRVPVMVFSELRTMMKSATEKEKESGLLKVEYAEFLVVKSGNLAGLVVKSGYDGESKDFYFPPVEVNAGDFVVVHPRLRGIGAVNELESDLSLSTGVFCKDNCRDLWGFEDKAFYGDKSDVILLVNSCDGKVIDAVMYAETGLDEWKKDLQKEYAELAVQNGVFRSAGTSAAVLSDGLTATKSLYRTGLSEILEKGNSAETEFGIIRFNAEDWAISQSSVDYVGILK